MGFRFTGDRKSTGGFVFTLARGAIAWSSKKQPIVALCTAEAEYVAACEATMEAFSERNVISDVLPTLTMEVRIGIDSQSAYVFGRELNVRQAHKTHCDGISCESKSS